jgi:hypothetical protein
MALDRGAVNHPASTQILIPSVIGDLPITPATVSDINAFLRPLRNVMGWRTPTAYQKQ